MELHEMQQELESMPLKNLGRTMFWLVGFMAFQGGECWDKFCEGVQSSPYFPQSNEAQK